MRVRAFVLAVALWAIAPGAGAQAPARLTDSAFAALVAQLSEPAGYFDTDNLISNEDAYLHPIGTLKRLGIAGGAYVGVGPDQNYSYIAAVRPRVAFIVDIRRDNLLQHLLYKSLFAAARNRVEFLALLIGKALPGDTAGWGARPMAALVAYADTARGGAEAAAVARARVQAGIRGLKVPLSAADLATIARFHDTFMLRGLGLRFNTFGRAPQPYYPDLRQLLTETDLTGRQSNYLAHEADFQTVKSLHARNLIVPVVGDFGGTTALRAVATWLRTHGETVSAMYTSNVEQYLFQNGTFETFALSVTRFPRTGQSVMIRSFFRGIHPQRVAGYHATLLLQSLERFASAHAAGGFGSYYALTHTHLIDR